MKRIKTPISILLLAVLSSLLLNACGPATPEPSPTVDIVAMQTSVVETFAAGLTQTAFLLPTDTSAPIPTNAPTPTTSLTTPLPPVSGQIPPASCYGLAYVKDVTIPDNSLIPPGQTFTKTWQVRNSGTCAWDAGFKFAFVGGEAMDGATLVLDKAVNPGADKELSIVMKAPSKTGSVRGTWRMSTAGGTFFGDPMFVLINLGNATTSVTPTITKTITKTTTAATATITKTSTVATATATMTATTAVPTATATTEAPTATPTPTETPTTGAP
jgi:hypothetical protein